MNYLEFRKRILATIQLNAILFSVEINATTNCEAVVANLSSIKMIGNIHHDTDVVAKVKNRSAINFKVEKINGNVDFSSSVNTGQALGVNIGRIVANSQIVVKSVLASLQAIKSKIDVGSKVLPAVNTATVLAIKPDINVLSNVKATIELLDDFTEMLTNIDASSNLAVAIDTVSGMVLYADINAISFGKVIINVLDSANFKSIIESRSSISALVGLIRRALVGDYYGDTISGALYGKTMSDFYYVAM